MNIKCLYKPQPTLPIPKMIVGYWNDDEQKWEQVHEKLLQLEEGLNMEKDERTFLEKFPLPVDKLPMLIEVAKPFYAIISRDEETGELKEQEVPPTDCCPDMTEREQAIGFFKLIYL